MEQKSAPAARAVENVLRPRAPRRHRLEENPPPPMKVMSIDQIEAANPGIKGRTRQWIKRADAGDIDFLWLRECIVRVGRSIFIDDVLFPASLHERTATPAAPARNKAPGKKRAEAEAEADT